MVSPHRGQGTVSNSSCRAPTAGSPVSMNSAIQRCDRTSASPSSNQIPWQPLQRSIVTSSHCTSSMSVSHFGHRMLSSPIAGVFTVFCDTFFSGFRDVAKPAECKHLAYVRTQGATTRQQHGYNIATPSQHRLSSASGFQHECNPVR
jgi:hypothetical protein